MNIQSIIFDFDGVILDTEIARYDAWQKIFHSYGQFLPLDIWIKSIGHARYVLDPFDLLSSLLDEKPDPEQIRALHRNFEMELVHSLSLLPGVEDRIREARSLGIRLAIASSSSHNWVEGNLHTRNLLEYFDAIVCREDTSVHKPSPEPYLKALELLNSSAQQSLAIEDSPIGIEAAVKAGLRCIAVGCSLTKNLDLSKAGMVISSLNEITFREFTYNDE